MTEPIIAYRTWRIETYGYFLTAMTSKIDSFYPYQIMSAQCYCHNCDQPYCRSGEPHDDEHRLPCTNGTCGIYAFKSLPDSIDFCLDQAQKPWTNKSRYLLGEVALWGKIEEHRKGFRAEFAYPKSFVFMKSDDNRLPTFREVSEFASAWAVDVEKAP